MQGENLRSAVLKWQRRRATGDAEQALQPQRRQIPLCSPPSLTAVPQALRCRHELPAAGQSGCKTALQPGLSPANSDFQQHPEQSLLLPVAPVRAELSLHVPHLTHHWVLVCRNQQECWLPIFLPALFPVGVLNVQGFE